MACCKCCCGGENCTEGQQGKCCCGGPSGTCCQAGEYCCSGACQAAPCDGDQACCLWGWCYDIGEWLTSEDCTYYGGSVVSGACADDPCPQPPTGACCDPYGGGCYVTSEYDCYGEWMGEDTTCSPSPCAYPGACCVDGVCQDVASEAECIELSGIYQGPNTDCTMGDCDEMACVPAGCSVNQCLKGHFSSVFSGTCSEEDPHPYINHRYCYNSIGSTITVTIGGVTGTDAGYINGSYVFDYSNCTKNIAQVSFPFSDPGYTVQIMFSLLYGLGDGPVSGQVKVTVSNFTTYGGGAIYGRSYSGSNYSTCDGLQRWECNYAGSYTLSSNSVPFPTIDLSGATVSVA